MICRQCGQDKPAGEFYWKSNGRIARGQKCRTCFSKNYATSKEKEITKERRLINKYNINSKDYQELFNKQDGKCAICKSNDNLHVDHDHETGQIRGLLCRKCNLALGILGDNWDSIYRVLQYLSGNLTWKQSQSLTKD